MVRVHVFRVGPVEDGKSLYVPIGGNRETREPTDLDPVESYDDLTALRQLVAQANGETLVCSLELANAANALGLAVEELPITYEALRVHLAMDHAQGGALSGIKGSRTELRLMSAIRDFLSSDFMSRWPVRHSFEVELRGDRNDTFAGFMTLEPAPSFTGSSGFQVARRIEI